MEPQVLRPQPSTRPGTLVYRNVPPWFLVLVAHDNSNRVPFDPVADGSELRETGRVSRKLLLFLFE